MSEPGTVHSRSKAQPAFWVGPARAGLPPLGASTPARPLDEAGSTGGEPKVR